MTTPAPNCPETTTLSNSPKTAKLVLPSHHQSSPVILYSTPRGSEQPQETPGNTQVSGESGAQSGALDPKTGILDARLLAIIDAWPTLADDAKDDIVAMVQPARKVPHEAAEAAGK